MLLVQIPGKRNNNIVLHVSIQVSDSQKFRERTVILKDQAVVGKNFKALASVFFCIKITASVWKKAFEK